MRSILLKEILNQRILHMKKTHDYIQEAKEALGLPSDRQRTHAILEKKGNEWIIIQTFSSEKDAIETYNNYDYSPDKFKVSAITWKDIHKKNKYNK
jgi:hypothetical protein